MDHPALVVPELTLAKLQTGEALIRVLDNAEIPVAAAFWLWSGEFVDWRLVIASPVVDALGTGGFYGQIVKHVVALNSYDVSVFNVTAISPTDPIVFALRNTLGVRPGINALRLTGNVVGGVFIPDAYIYRLT